MSTVRQLKLNLLADTSDFQAGIKRATGETQSFQTKLKDSAVKIGKSFAIAGAAAGALALKVGVDSVKAALDDQKAQRRLAIALKNTTGATKKQVAGIEKYITKTSLAYGVTDDELRPAFQKLTQVTKSTTKAQELMTLALDVSAGTGKSVESVSLALSRAYGGNLTGLKKLGIGLDQNTIKTKDSKKAFQELSDTYGGQAQAAADSLEGKMKRLQIALDETKESIGEALLPIVERMATFMTKTGVPAIEGLVAAFTGKDGKDLEGAGESAYRAGIRIKDGLKWVLDHREQFAMFAVAWAGFWAGNKALIATTGIVNALKTIRAAMVLTTAASATAATAEAAATGGASLIPALGAMAALALYFGIKKFGWSGDSGQTADFNKGFHTGGILSGGKMWYKDAESGKWYTESMGENGTTREYRNTKPKRDTSPAGANPNGTITYEGANDPDNPFTNRRGFRQAPVTNVINLNGIVDAESARRSIEQVLQRSSLRSGAINLVGSAI